MSEWTDRRPLSPHLQVWRWHPTMLTSILHRVTGAANYVALLGVVVWLMAAAAGPQAYATVQGLLGHPLVWIVLLGAVLGLSLHIASGVRHLVWDFLNIGWSPRAANLGSWMILGGGVVMTALVALHAFGMGGR